MDIRQVRLVAVREHPELAALAIDAYSAWWSGGQRRDLYDDCVRHSLDTPSTLPRWYLLLAGDEAIGGAGMISNDFISRMDLWPWLCAVYVAEPYRGRRLAGRLICRVKADARAAGFEALYVATNLRGFYERYGFAEIGVGYHPWGEQSRLFKAPLPSLSERVQRVLADDVAVCDYDPRWPELFAAEKALLESLVPDGYFRRIEHFGSTAVPGLAAKPVIDLLLEVESLAAARVLLPPILEAEGYDYFWRPTFGNDGGPWYCWFIKRGEQGERLAHLHVVEKSFAGHWQRLQFRDYLREHPAVAQEYADLKRRLAAENGHDRVAYTDAKGDFIRRMTALACGVNPQAEDIDKRQPAQKDDDEKR